MKKVFIFSLVFLFFLGTNVSAQDSDLPDVGLSASKAGLTPDSPFYFLERIVEGIGTFFTFGDIKKAERYARLAAERLAEAQAVMEKGKPELAAKTLARYEKQLVRASYRIEKARLKGKDTKEAAKAITEATQKHSAVLAKVLEQAPEEAKPAIEQAITVSSKKGLEQAVDAFILKELTSASGQTYKDLEAKCLKYGGAPEICSGAEEKCNLIGATTADECEQMNLETFNRLSPGPVMILKEETEERRKQKGDEEAAIREAQGKVIEEIRRQGEEVYIQGENEELRIMN